MTNPITRSLSMLEHSYVPSVPGILSSSEMASFVKGGSVGSSGVLPSGIVSAKQGPGQAKSNAWAWIQIALGFGGLVWIAYYLNRQIDEDRRRS